MVVKTGWTVLSEWINFDPPPKITRSLLMISGGIEVDLSQIRLILEAKPGDDPWKQSYSRDKCFITLFKVIKQNTRLMW